MFIIRTRNKNNYGKKDIIPLKKKEEKTIISKKDVTYAKKNLIHMIAIK